MLCTLILNFTSHTYRLNNVTLNTIVTKYYTINIVVCPSIVISLSHLLLSQLSSQLVHSQMRVSDESIQLVFVQILILSVHVDVRDDRFELLLTMIE